MPQLVEMYIRHTLIGFALSAAFVALLFYFNVMNLWHLISNSPDGVLAGFLLFMFNGIVFSGVQFGVAIMTMGEERARDGDGGSRPMTPLHQPAPVPVRVRDEPRR